jgi:RND family efflux transporter MFP subunit
MKPSQTQPGVPTTAGPVRNRRGRALWRAVPLALLATALLASCDEESAEEAVEAAPRPVRVVTVEERTGGEEVSLSGVIESKTSVDFAFRVGGRLVERSVDVGDRVEAGDVIARLDDADERSALQAARSDLVAAEGQFIEAEVNFERQAQLLERGFTTRQRYDEAVQVLRTLRARVEAAQARVQIAKTRLEDTVLVVDAPGVVTERGAEPGEVVGPGQMVVRLARDDGRDAVFDAPADLIGRADRNVPVEVSLSINSDVTATGRVREVSPQADPVTGTFRVRVGLIEPPEPMRLGSTVTGRMTLESDAGIAVPASALHRTRGSPAVWVVDPESGTVSLRQVELASHRPTEVLVQGGLAPGEVVVTAGVQTLRAGQRVRLLGDAS